MTDVSVYPFQTLNIEQQSVEQLRQIESEKASDAKFESNICEFESS